ncbi:transglutaminase-like cysteine peptidase [Pseudogemmobacter sp. W21_MBD1_M6]|uniref:transglutaminase-like cysteine peptidase n=1 Tax=Pseudogemmobacter sp. W21_MBD1_M6 TaxID=3240271 RepID=UPI003F96F67C
MTGVFRAACGAALTLASILAPAPVVAANSTNAFLVAQYPVTAPPGSKGLCANYAWACASDRAASPSGPADLALARSVNSSVNRKTRQIEDQQQYGQAERWALPTTRGGDCEDIVLLKKMKLMQAGVASSNLLIATVLDRKNSSHAVLVMRTDRGDLVLDSLNSRIVHWTDTGYTFLKMQNPASLGSWYAVLAGHMLKDRPTASR